MGKAIKAVAAPVTGVLNMLKPAKVNPQIAAKDLFDISKEVKPAQEAYAPLLQQSQAQQQAVAPLQTQALTQLGMAATGQGPSLAEVQMKAAQDRNLAQQLAAIQAARGGSAAANQRALLQGMGQAGRDIGQQAAAARLQERDQFLNQANIASQNLRTDIGGKLNLDLMPKQSLQGWEQQRVGAVNAAQAQNAASKNALTGALVGGAASILGGMATGGTGLFAKPPVPAKDGGKIRGPGTETSDSIPARLSDGEFVIKAAMVKKPGMEKVLHAINSGKVDAKALAAALKKAKSKKKDA